MNCLGGLLEYFPVFSLYKGKTCPEMLIIDTFFVYHLVNVAYCITQDYDGKHTINNTIFLILFFHPFTVVVHFTVMVCIMYCDKQ